MDRQRRKSRANTIVDSGSDASDGERRKKKKSGGTTKSRRKSRANPSIDSNGYTDNDVSDEEKNTRFRITPEMDELFVKKCVENFEKINSMATLKGSFTQRKQTELKKIREKIAKECNTDFKVSNFQLMLFLNSLSHRMKK